MDTHKPKLTLSLKRHVFRGVAMAELRDKDGVLVAGIYPTDRGLKIVSRHIAGRRHDADLLVIDTEEPMAVLVNLV